MSHSVGMYNGDNTPEDQALLVTERCCFSNLLEGLYSPCPCEVTAKRWVIDL